MYFNKARHLVAEVYVQRRERPLQGNINTEHAIVARNVSLLTGGAL